MANDTYGSVNGIRSTIVNEPVSLPASDNTANSIFIYGTAPNGPLYTPTKVTSDTVTQIFGSYTANQPYADRSLLKAYYEAVAAAGTNQAFDVRLIRVGNVGNASVTLYEMIGGTGVHARTSGVVSQSIKLECSESGRTGNGNTVIVTGTSGIPEVLTIAMTTGKTATFNLDPINEAPNYIANVYELLQAINGNADVQEAGIVATTQLVEEEISFAYAGTTLIDLSDDGESYGDNLVDVTNAYSLSDNTDVMEAGLATTVLSEVPEKTADIEDKTIDSFNIIKTNELILEVNVANIAKVGSRTVDLLCKNDTFWNKDIDLTLSAVTVIRAGVSITIPVASIDVTKATIGDTATITLPTVGTTFTGFVSGDRVTASYKYNVNYSEAKVRSQLVSGSRESYFVTGDTIVFGAPQSYRLEINYKGKQEYLWGTDLQLYSRANSQIIFSNPANVPVTGDTIYLTLRFLPELPSPTGDTLDAITGQIQTGQFTGGEDGQSMSLASYKTEVQKGLDLSFGYPCAAIAIAGAYLDDSVIGYNSETGMKESQNIGWHTMLVDYVTRKSNYVSECKCYIGLKVLESNTAEAQAEYLNKLITVSATDTNRPANIVVGIESYPLIITANDFVVAVSSVSSSLYKTSPAVIYAAARQSQDLATSPITLSNGMPSCVRGLSVTAVDHATLNQINRMRYTFFIQDTVGQTGNFIPADAPTLAATGSSLDRQYVLDIVYMCGRTLRARLQQFIGKANDARNRQSMETVAKSALKEFSPEFLSGFDVKVTADAQDKIDGNTKIKYVLITSREIRTIQQETRLKLV